MKIKKGEKMIKAVMLFLMMGKELKKFRKETVGRQVGSEKSEIEYEKRAIGYMRVWTYDKIFIKGGERGEYLNVCIQIERWDGDYILNVHGTDYELISYSVKTTGRLKKLRDVENYKGEVKEKIEGIIRDLVKI